MTKKYFNKPAITIFLFFFGLSIVLNFLFLPILKTNNVKAQSILFDNFDRSDSSALGAVSSGGYTWSEASGDINIVSNKARPAATTNFNIAVISENIGNDYYVQADATSCSNCDPGVIARYTGTGEANFYLLRLNGANLELYKSQLGSYTPLGSYSTTLGTHTIRLEVRGNSLNAYLDGVLRITAADSSLLSGQPGIRSYYVNNGQTWDNFEAGLLGAPDTVSPANISDLTLTNITSNSVLLTWTAPGDDNNFGIAASYDIRYSTSNITESNWPQAAQVAGEPAPQIAGTQQSMTASGLSSGITYYFAIKTLDEALNISGLSNVVSGTIRLVSSVKSTHPRIWLTDSILNDLKARAAANSPEWVALKGYNDKYLTTDLNGSYRSGEWARAVANYALGYQVLKDSNPSLADQYAARVLVYMKALARDKQNVGDGLGGEPAKLDDFGYTIRNLAFLSVGYDWIYDYSGFTDALKSEFINRMNEWLDYWTANQLNYFITVAPSEKIVINNYFGGYLLALGLTGYATYSDNSRASEHIERARNLLDSWVIPAFNSEFKGGYSPEGWSYGANHFVRIISYIYAIKTATGEDIFSTFAWPKEVILAQIHLTKPWQFLFYDGGAWPGSFSGTNARPVAELLSTIYAGSQEGRYVQYYLNQLPPISYAYVSPEWHKFLWYDPGASAETYTNLPLSYLASGTGLATMRSDWSSDAIWASFVASKYFAGHQKFDQGHFTINRGSDYLVIDSGIWQGSQGYANDGAGSHYSGRSEFVNTLLVDDPGDGNLEYPPGQASRGDLVKMKAFQEGGSYFYALGDIADAYSPPPDWIRWAGKQKAVTNFTREFVFLRPNYFIIFDRVSTIDDRYSKRWAIHFKNEPNISGDISQAVFGSSKVFLKTLAPSPALIEKYGEPADGQTTGALTWRLEVANPAAVKDIQFLNVINVDSSSAVSMPATFRIDSTNYTGALIQDPTNPRIVMFSKTEVPQTTLTYNVTYSGTGKHLIVDLQPGTYDVFKNGTKILSNVSASQEGALSFDSTGGSTFQVVQTGTTPPPSDTTPPAPPTGVRVE